MAAILSAFKYVVLPSLTTHFHRPAPRFTQRSPHRPPGAHAVRDVHVHVRPGRHHGPTVRRRQGRAARREPLPTTPDPRAHPALSSFAPGAARSTAVRRAPSPATTARISLCTQRPYSARRTQNGSDGSTASGSPPRSARSRPKCVSTSSSTPPVSPLVRVAPRTARAHAPARRREELSDRGGPLTLSSGQLILAYDIRLEYSDQCAGINCAEWASVRYPERLQLLL